MRIVGRETWNTGGLCLAALRSMRDLENVRRGISESWGNRYGDNSVRDREELAIGIFISETSFFGKIAFGDSKVCLNIFVTIECYVM